MKAKTVYAALSKKINSVISGVSSVSVNGTILTFSFADGTSATMTFNQPSDGKDGKGIVSVEKTAGDGLPGSTDTYTITYTDNTTGTFNIINGANGADGKDGLDGGASPQEIIFADDTGTITQTIKPNTYYLFGACDEIELTFEAGEDGQANEYMWVMTTTSADGMSIILPEGVVWQNEPSCSTNDICECSVLNGLGITAKW